MATTAGKPRRIADELRSMIIAGSLDEGDLLGTEAELLERFAVSRPSLREALRILEADGLISVVRGVLGGVVVHRPDQRITARAAAVVLQSRSVPLADVFEASAVIVPAAARMVATSHRRGIAAEKLRTRIEEQRRAFDDPPTWTASVIDYHGDLVRLSGNQTLVLICEMLNEVIARAVADLLAVSATVPAAAQRSRTGELAELTELIAAGDGEGAQAQLSDYLAKLQSAVLGTKGSALVVAAPHL
ncbi:MAG: GntR family transcriptional regulator [Mycolicibacterium insubricum]